MNSISKVLGILFSLFLTVVVCAFFPHWSSFTIFENVDNGDGLWVNNFKLQSNIIHAVPQSQFILTTSTSNRSWLEQKAISLEQDTIEIFIQLGGDDATEGKTWVDTFSMGELPSGNYFVNLIVYSNQGMVDTSTLLIIGGLEVYDLDRENSRLAVFPNPAKHYLSLYGTYTSSIQRAEIIDLNGTVVKSLNSGYEHIDVSDLPGGIYIIQVQANNVILAQKFLVLR